MIALINQPHVSTNTEAPLPMQHDTKKSDTSNKIPAIPSEEHYQPATVIILVVPSRGAGPDSKGVISGRVGGLSDTTKYRIVLYAFTDRWYVQPTSDEPLTFIHGNGNWESTTHLGSEYAALLVASSFDPPESPDFIPGGDAVIAFTKIEATIHP